MKGNRPTTKEFSWVPPPLTVMRVSPKPKRKIDNQELKKTASESYAIPPAHVSKPEGDLHREIQKKNWDLLTLGLRERSKSAFNGTEARREERPRAATYEPNDAITNGKKRPEPNVFAKTKIGNTSLDLGRIFASRKISEFNPSQKFVSLSYQADCNESGELQSIEEGAAYARRITTPDIRENETKSKNNKTSSPTNEKSKSKKDKGRSGNLKEKRQPVAENLIINEVVDVQESSNHVYDILYDLESMSGDEDVENKSKKKSVFEMKELQDESVDIGNLLSRKVSQESINDKFVSISYETQRVRKSNWANQPSRNVHGGMYARKVKKGGQYSKNTTTGLKPVPERTNEVERERKTSKFVNSAVKSSDRFEVGEILSRRRKESEESIGGEKFISMCWQQEENMPRDSLRAGGLYAKRVPSKTIS